MFPKLDAPSSRLSALGEFDSQPALDADDAAALYRQALKSVCFQRHPQQNILPSRVLINRWNRTSRLYSWRHKRWQKDLDRLREAARKGGVVCDGFHEDPDRHFAYLSAFKWLIRVGELSLRQLAAARRADWAMQLCGDLLLATVDLRRSANWQQMRLAIDAEMHLLREMRWIFANKKVAAAHAEQAVEQAKRTFADPMQRSEFFAAEYLRRCKSRGQIADDRENLRRAIYTCLIEYEDQSQSAHLFQHDNGQTRFLFPSEFVTKYGLPYSSTSIVDNELQAELHDLFVICETMDARDTAAAATLAYLCLLAYHRRLGFYPENLASATAEFGVDALRDSFTVDHLLQVRMAGGEKLKGYGVENFGRRIRTKQGQPLIYSVGPDQADDNATIVWDGAYQGKGDWIFPLPAHHQPRHWSQFNLRKVMIFTLLAALFLARFSSPASRLHRARANVENLGVHVYSESDDESVEWSIVHWFVPPEAAEPISISIEESSDVGAVLAAASEFTELESISIATSQLKPGDFRFLRNFSELNTLNISSTPLSHDHITILDSLVAIENLSITDHSISDDVLVQLPRLPHVISLCLNGNFINGSGLRDISDKLPKLDSLVLYETNVNNSGVAHLVECKQLTHLDLDSSNVTNPGMKHVGKIGSLDSLDLQRTRLTDDCLKHLKGLANLNTLLLNSSPFDGSGLTHICQLPKLQQLEMDDTKIVDKHLAILNRFPALTDISLAETKISPSGARRIQIPRASINFPDWTVSPMLPAPANVPVPSSAPVANLDQPVRIAPPPNP